MQTPTLLDLSRAHNTQTERTCAPHTVVAYSQSWRLVLLPLLGPDTHVDRVSRAAVRAAHGEYGSDYPSAANRALAVLRSAWVLAEDLGWVEPGRCPAAGVRKLPEERQQRPLEPHESRVLWALSNDCLEGRARVVPRTMAAGFVLIIGTGLRRTAAFGLRKIDFNLARGTVSVRRDKTTKRRGPQDLALGPQVVAVLRRYLPTVDSEWAFPSNRTGRPWREVNKAWRRLCDAAGVDGATIRDARTGIATAALEDGEELRAIQHQLHHASISTTARYARVTPRRARAAAKRMESAVLDPRRRPA